MDVIKKSEFAKMSANELSAKLFELRKELNTERGLAASGGRSQDPGRIRELRRTVARILTVLPSREGQGIDKSKKVEEKSSKPASADEKKASNRGEN